jgi:hypothetical protein
MQTDGNMMFYLAIFFVAIIFMMMMIMR